MARRADTVAYDRRQRERIIAVTRKGYSAALAAALAALLAASCQQFFTTSIVKGLARDSSSYKFPADLAVSDAAYYLAQSQGDPAVAAALVTPLFNAVQAATPGTAAYDQAAQLLAEAVVQSSGINQALTDTIAALPSDLSTIDQATLESLVTNFASVGLNATEIAALNVLATDPPSTLSAEQAYTIAGILFLQAIAGTPGASLNDLNTLSAVSTDLTATPAFTLASDFLDLATAIDGPSPSTLIGGLLNDLAGLLQP